MRRDAPARSWSVTRWTIVVILLGWSALMAWAPWQDEAVVGTELPGYELYE